MPLCPMCSNNAILGFMGLSALIFFISGAIFVAPYWLYDGISFGIETYLGYNAIKEINGKTLVATERSEKNKKATATYCLAAFSILVEITFLIVAVTHWNKVMNPFHWTDYGSQGKHFTFCSAYSACCNTFVVIHFRLLSQQKPLEEF